MRVVIDTNVLVRAVPGAGGPAREVLLQITDDPHTLIVSPFMLEEFGEALHYERLRAIHGLDDAGIEDALDHLRNASLIVEPAETDVAPVVGADPDDDQVIAAAVAAQAEVICTLDRHFRNPDVQAYCDARGIRVMDDVAPLKLLVADSEGENTS